ncbi:MAG: indolepyruvate oxidoreductase subunit beta [Bacteroidaceae bacterium]|nr:indolepyruvate oxidoreductase subunit beta [Bacteroidaceae bacterium]
MKKDIILSGVGGQGILSIATVIGDAATNAGLYLKQAEVHGMSQRGGDVQSHLRLSHDPIYSDLIPQGETDVIISMEPMEALRYVSWLKPTGWLVTSSQPLINIPNYPDTEALQQELASQPQVARLNIETMAKEAQTPKSANMILLGMAAPYIEIISPEDLRNSIINIFKSKGEKIISDNLKAFDLGYNTTKR